MQSRKMAPKEVHILIPRTSVYVTLQDKNDFASVRTGNHSNDYKNPEKVSKALSFKCSLAAIGALVLPLG